MESNKEVKIAIVIGLIMLTLCAVILISNNSSKKETANTDIKVYKNINNKYYECQTTTEDIITINNEYKKIKNLSDDNKAPGQKITGTYRVANGDDFIAFDANNKLVWRGDANALYLYDSSLYEYVVNLCK